MYHRDNAAVWATECLDSIEEVSELEARSDSIADDVSLVIGNDTVEEIGVEEVMCCEASMGSMWSYFLSTSIKNEYSDTMVCIYHGDTKSVLCDYNVIVGVQSGAFMYSVDTRTLNGLFYALHIIGISVVIGKQKSFTIEDSESGSGIEYIGIDVQSSRESSWEESSMCMVNGDMKINRMAVATAVVTLSITLEPSSTNGGSLPYTKKPIFTLHNIKHVMHLRSMQPSVGTESENGI